MYIYIYIYIYIYSMHIYKAAERQGAKVPTQNVDAYNEQV